MEKIFFRISVQCFLQSDTVSLRIYLMLCELMVGLGFFFSDNLNEMLGELFKPCETPEAPKQGFFKNWFSAGHSTLDREELCKTSLYSYTVNYRIYVE